MGVPAFFRWLSRKYPSVIVHCIEDKANIVNGVRVPNDASQPNPNGVEFDNLYLDMNGIIHPCTHPEDRPAPRNEDEMMVAIFDCIDRLFGIVRPRKVLYMAIDGVAPRAKMNQQRSRRFRAAKETVERIGEIRRVRTELILRGASLPAEKPKEEHFDSNCITPGTPFMSRLSDCLHYYIYERLNNDPGWKGIKVILSDANVPGEGEHKIMDYIRKQRAQPDHDPNTQHCLCGADADLIMLGLATHEPNFTIIREEFKPNKPKPCEICGQLGHEMKDCIGGANSAEESLKVFSETEFIFVRLNVLKEYLKRELQMPNLPFEYDFERVIDDWVFMCFFVGNDFLPHLPSLEIRENAIDRLVRLYKDCVYKTGGWLTDSGDVNLERVQMIMHELGRAEDEIFKQRQQKELQFKARDKARKKREAHNQNRPNWDLTRNTQFAPSSVGQSRPVSNPRQAAFEMRKAGMHSQAGGAQEALESMLVVGGGGGQASAEDEEVDDQAHDEVRLWEDGFKDRYYESKFDVGGDNMEFRNNVALHYVKGLCWVLRYYYQGCASWKWYFPYHYAPFASDFVHISGLSTEFERDTIPFKPLEQLMGVFPAASSTHVPPAWAELMSDVESTIIDFYPEDFKIDLNGKKFAWQGVALLPFVDETRLFTALKPYYKNLSDIEIQRNIRGDDRLYVGTLNSKYDFLKALYEQNIDSDAEVHVSIDGMQGRVLLATNAVPMGGRLLSPVAGLDEIERNLVCCVRYRDPKYSPDFIFPACRLKGAEEPRTVLKPNDLEPEANRNWRPQIGMTPSTTRATLDGAGHRMMKHYNPNYNNGSDRRNNYYNNRGGHNSNNRDGNTSYGNRGGGYHQNYNPGGGFNSPRGGGGGGGNYQQGYSTRGHDQGANRPYNRNNRHEPYRRPAGPYREGYQTGGGGGGGGGGYQSQNSQNYRR